MNRSTFAVNQIVRNVQSPSTTEYTIVRKHPGTMTAQPAYDLRNRVSGQVFRMVNQSNLRKM
jgi:hypothetical protein